MNRNGFSLVELVVTMIIAGILLSIATLQFSSYLKKSSIEAQFSAIQADLVNVRSQALFQKRDRSVTFSANEFDIYSSATVSGAEPIRRVTLTNGIALTNADPITFDSRGIISNLPSSDMSICLDPYDSSPRVDSLVLTAMQIQLGKRDATGCDSAHITIK